MRRLLLGMSALAVVSALLLPTSAEAASRPSADTLRAKILTLVNRARVDAGCRKVARDSHLQTAAQRHTKRMAAARTMSHQLKGEVGLAKRVQRAGYRHWTTIGENVAYGYPSAKAVMRAWMHSAPHRANILNCDFRDLGIGVVRTRNGQLWYTQDFGRN